MNNKSCLIIIDVQKGIFKLKQPVYNQDRLIVNVKETIKSAKDNNITIIYTQHENKTFLIKDSVDWEFVDDIKPTGEDHLIIYKKHPGIFKDTNLLDLLRQKEINKLYIAGLISNGCVKDACLDGLKNGYDVILIANAHSTFNKNAAKIIAKVNDEMKSQGITLKKYSELW